MLKHVQLLRMPFSESRPLRYWIALLVIATQIPILGTRELEAEEIEFNRDVRPILSDHCFACHGPDKNRREADLRLDTREGLIGTQDAMGVVVPKKPDESELFRRILSEDSEQRMPPPHFAKDLSSEQKAILRTWIEQGAVYEGHWAFQPVKRPDLPWHTDSNNPEQGSATKANSNREDAVQNEIDLFIDQAIIKRGLQIAPQADRRTLIRRLSFDLLGLPPTNEQVESFVADENPDAYERLIDRLLSSEHFGERMAVWWLDLVRYADSVGYHGDQGMSVSPYRDYVIRAFNDNVPFDRFTIEQIAGDLLPNADQDALIASGYNRLGMMSAEGGVQDKEYLAKYIAERVRNVSGTWMGVTMGCCECHDHKYDPFTSREFYSMEAFFADIEEKGLYSGAHETGIWGPSIKVPTPEQAERQKLLDQKIASIREQTESTPPEFERELREWSDALPRWRTVSPKR